MGGPCLFVVVNIFVVVVVVVVVKVYILHVGFPCNIKCVDLIMHAWSHKEKNNNVTCLRWGPLMRGLRVPCLIKEMAMSLVTL